MNLAFVASDKPREQDLAAAFAEGCARHGDTCERLAQGDAMPRGLDAVGMVGVKSVEAWRAAQDSGAVPIMFDKGYLRHRALGSRTWEYWLIAIGAHHPTAAITAREWPSDRWESFGLPMRPWRDGGKHILIAGSSAKYHRFHGLPDPTTYASDLVKEIKRHSRRPIVYRPKPSWRDAEPIPGTRYSGDDRNITAELAEAWCLVTHGSNACFEAILAGVPCIILGDAVARPISSTRVRDMRNPRTATDGARRAWLAALCYHQWTLEEFASGEAWRWIRQEMMDVGAAQY